MNTLIYSTAEYPAMTETFTASLVRESPWVIAQCLEVDIASQGRDEEEALANLREALELHYSKLRRPRSFRT